MGLAAAIGSALIIVGVVESESSSLCMQLIFSAKSFANSLQHSTEHYISFAGGAK